MTVNIETLTVGPLEVNCYLVGCDEHRACAVFDPGDSPGRILQSIDSRGWNATHIINTHGHADHTGANDTIKQATGAPLCIHKNDAGLLTHPDMREMAAYIGVAASSPADTLLDDGEVIRLCACLQFELMATPGHTKGGACFLFDNAVITGDTLFKLSIGRSDLLGGDHEALMRSIQSKLLPLPDEVTVYPGHGEPTTIGHERANNPFVTARFR